MGKNLNTVTYNTKDAERILTLIKNKGPLNYKDVQHYCQIASNITGVKKIKFLTKNSVKIEKSNKLKQELNVIMHLAPHKISGYNVCPNASRGCANSCLNLSGHGVYRKVQESRIKKAKLFFEHRSLFMIVLYKDIALWERRAEKQGMRLAVRLNGTSDIVFEKISPWIFTVFPDVIFYDYTKIAKRFERKLPNNYNLTFSRSENNYQDCRQVLKSKGNVAVVFKNLNNALSKKYYGRKVLDGTITDRRFADYDSNIIGLKALGKARLDKTGFVVQNNQDKK